MLSRQCRLRANGSAEQRNGVDRQRDARPRGQRRDVKGAARRKEARKRCAQRRRVAQADKGERFGELQLLDEPIGERAR